MPENGSDAAWFLDYDLTRQGGLGIIDVRRLLAAADVERADRPHRAPVGLGRRKQRADQRLGARRGRCALRSVDRSRDRRRHRPARTADASPDRAQLRHRRHEPARPQARRDRRDRRSRHVSRPSRLQPGPRLRLHAATVRARPQRLRSRHLVERHLHRRLLPDAQRIRRGAAGGDDSRGVGPSPARTTAGSSRSSCRARAAPRTTTAGCGTASTSPRCSGPAILP